MSKLELILLGRFECLLPSGTRISLSMRKAEVLLAYLALTPGLRHPRERLINLLWSDRGEEQARNSLRQCLSAIKKSLGEVADLVLLVDRTTVSLIPELIDIDVHEFERLATEGDYESLTTAADLYQGEFLEGISIRDAACQEWLDGERSRFKRQFIEILSNLAETQLLSHDFGHAIKSAERLVKQDPLGESGWRLLMRAYFDNGDRSHALQAFKRCQQGLRDELDVDPEAVTIELRDQIAGGEANPEPEPAPIARNPPVDSPLSTDHSIAVLPFDNLSGDPEQEYFSDGITDSIILNLSLFPGLNVKSRNSSFAFKQQIKSLGEISKELGVDYIVEGNIRKSEHHVRITVQLIEAGGGNQIWGKRYDADLTDLFSLEEELSRAVAATVTGQIESELQRIAIAKGAAGQEAYDLLLSGIYHNYRFNRWDTVIAIEKLNRCLAIDPDNVRAHKQLYTCHLMDYLERWSEDYLASFELAAEQIHKALALAPESGMVLIFFAQYLVFRGEFDQAAPYLDKALAINPNDPYALATQALSLEIQGEPETALQAAERACLLDPYHPWAEWEVAVSQFLSGRYESALGTISKSRTSPGFIQIFGIVSNVKLGRIDIARQALLDFLQECSENMLSMPAAPDEWLRYTRENYPFKDPQINQDLIDCLLQAGLKDGLSPRHAGPESTEHSIAVLPFDNLSGDPGQEYFSDGISESIILNLSLFPGLKVKSRNSSFAFKQQIKSPGDISRELAVDYVLEGSVRKTKDRIRITVQLIDAGSEDQIWGKRYDSDLDDLFDLEEELSRSIAATVTGQIESDLQRIAIAKSATEQESYDLLLSGIYHAQRYDGQDAVIAIDKLTRCLAKDPDNVRAHVYLYICHSMNFLERWFEDYRASVELASKHICRALELGPEMALVQAFYAEYLIFFCGELDQALSHLNKALEINPNDADALTVMTLCLEFQGKFEAALEMAERTYQLDPYHPWIEWELVGTQYLNGRYQDALDTIANASTPPSFTRIFSITANIKLGRADAARQALEIFLQDCRQSMFSVPKTIDEWSRYIKDNYSFKDTRHTQDIIDCMLQAGLGDDTASHPTQFQSDDHSIAVLPFDNLSGDPAQEYFSDGITESIILNLSLFPGLNVKSRNSSFAFKQQIKSPGEISKELEVDYLVEGSIRKTDEHIRVTVQLVDATSGNQVWGKRYDAEIENLFDLEEELSRTIAATVTGQIESDLQRIAINKGAAHQQSYDLLLEGIYHSSKNNASEMVIAIDKLNQCLALDPENARAHAMLSYCYEMNWIDRWVTDFEASRQLSREHARKALALDPELGMALVAYAEHLVFSSNYEEAEVHLKKALKINPNDSEALAVRAVNLSSQGKFEAALEQAGLALQLDPYHTWARWILSETQFFCGLYEDVLATIADTEVPPGFVQIYKIAANVRLGRMEVARETLQSFLQHCRESMASMPRTIDEWLAYSRDNAPFADPAFNQEIIDYLLQTGLAEEIAGAQSSAEPEALPTILVLPFSNLSGDPEQEYFSDGITESIIVNLGTVNGLKVKSIHASFAFKDSDRSLDEIAAELGVQYIVEGSIRKFGDKVRITAQLADTASGNQVWGKRFDNELEDLFVLEEELSLTIAGTVSGRVDKEAQLSAMRKPARDMKSYDYFLRAIHHVTHFNAKDVKTGIELFEKCLELDPDNATAHATLGSTYMVQIYENYAEDRDQTRKLMMQHLERALELDPGNAITHSYLAEALHLSKDFERGVAHARKAVELNPTLADGHAMLSLFASTNRQHDEAIKYSELSMQIDPYHPWIGWNAGEIYRNAEDYERAIEIFRALPHLSVSVHAQIAACLAGLGRLDEAREEMRQYLALAHEQMISIPADKTEWYRFWDETMPYKNKEDTDRYFGLLLQAGLCDQPEAESDAIPSIAVLPFENMSGDPEQEYFSDGITAGIILSLGMFKGLSVKSQRSSFAFKNSVQSSREIGEALGVDYLVEGSIRKSDTKVRISAQLVEAADGNQVWGRQYNAEAEDVLNLEQELSQTIGATISGRVGHTLQLSALRKPAKDLKSYDFYLRGLHHFGKFTPQDLAIAVDQFEQCIKIDPDNAEAHMQLGMIHEIYGYENWTEDREKSAELSEHHLRKAVELAPDNAWVHAYLSERLLYTYDLDHAEYHADKAIELNPNLPEAYAAKAQVTMLDRRYDEALECARLCVQLDPYNSGAAWAAGETYLICGEYEKSVKTFRSIETPPNVVRAQIAAGLAGMGQLELAKKEMQLFLDNARKNMPNFPSSIEVWREFWREYLPFKFEEDSENYVDLLVKAGLCDYLDEAEDDMPSIAVLPFENMSGDPEQEYFSDGITASIILSLGLFNGLTVKSQNSSFAFKNSGKSSEEIADELKAAYLVEGSIRKSAHKVRISVQLIESASGNQIWGKQYDAELEDILELEQEMSQTIAATISGRIGHTLQQSAVRKSARNLQSYDYLLRGLYYFGKFTARDFVKAKQEIEKCLEIDPDNSTAHTNLGMINWVEILEGWTDDQANSERLTVLHLDAAIEIEPDNALAHCYLGEYLFFKRDYERSEFHADKAIELNPTASEGYVVKADLLSLTRRIDEAITYADKCLQLDPHSIGAGWTAGGVYKGAGLFEKAIKTFRSIPHPPASIHALTAACFVGLGLADEAHREMKKYQELARREMPSYPGDENAWRRQWRISMAYQHDEDFEAAFDQLVEAGLLEDLTGPLEETPSIAVLPFENMSGDPDQEHFADGITTDIIATLSKFKRMRTVARYSILQYKDQKTSIADIAGQQKVRYILEGSVRKSGERIRVSAELIDAQTDQACWSERFDRDLDDLFAVQDEITQSIALAMKVQMDDGEMAQHRSKGATSIKAWELTLAAVDLADTYIRQNILDARAMANEAIRLDPDYAFAWITLGWTYWQEAYSGWSDSIEELIEEAEKANQHAMSLDPDYGETWLLAGMNHQMKHEAEAAIAACLRAVELEPGSSDVHALTAWAYLANGDCEAAHRHEQRMLNLCPIRPNWYYGVSGGIEKKCGNLDLAIELFQQGLEVEPDAPLCRFLLIDALMEKGETARAQQLAEEIRALDKSMTGKGMVQSNSYDAGERQRFYANLAKFDLV